MPYFLPTFIKVVPEEWRNVGEKLGKIGVMFTTLAIYSGQHPLGNAGHLQYLKRFWEQFRDVENILG